MVSVFLACDAYQFVGMVVDFYVFSIVRYSQEELVSRTNPLVVMDIGDNLDLEVFEDDHVYGTWGKVS